MSKEVADETLAQSETVESPDLDVLARTLATITSIACYTGLWALGVVAGMLLHPALGGVAAAIYFGARKSKSERRGRWIRDISLPVLVGVATKIIANFGLGAALWPFPVIPIVIAGGIAFGVVRRGLFFVRVFTNVVLKVIAVPAVLVTAVFIGFVGIWIVAGGMLVPAELVTPSTIAEGWTSTTPVNFLVKTQTYVKGSAAIRILGEYGPLTEEETRQAFEEWSRALLTALTVAGAGRMTTSELDHSDIIMPNGAHRYTRHYQIEQSVSTPKMELFVQFFYCKDLELSVSAYALIKEEPFEQLILEAREMIESLHCL
jgi:hypothetical protein